MSLPKQSVNVGLLFLADDSDTTNNRVEYRIVVQNQDIEVVPEFFSGGAFDESIGGKRISNLRGYRIRINLSYQASREATEKKVGNAGGYASATFRELFNEIMSCFSTDEILESLPDTQSFGSLKIRIDQADGTSDAIPLSAGSGSFMSFIPEDMSYTQTYSNQIGRFVPALTLISETLTPNIPEQLQGVL